jgi:hypothetical protein
MAWTVQGSSHPFGWKDDPDAVAEVVKRLGGRALFQDAAPHLAGFGAGKTVVLHEAAKKALGKFLQSQFQPRGTCVSRGAKRVNDLLQVIGIANGNLPFQFQYLSHAYIYGTCRMHGNDLSNEDGAVGAWAAWSCANDGNLTNADVGDDDNKDDLAVKWGARGVPSDVREKGKLHLSTGVAQVRSSDEIRDSVCALKPVTCASDVGFEPFRRNQDGVCRRGGSWPHQMCVTGYRDDLDAFLLDQSWGPDQPSGPIGTIDIPSYSFWIMRRDMDAIVRQGDCWSFAGLNGWMAESFSWMFGQN